METDGHLGALVSPFQMDVIGVAGYAYVPYSSLESVIERNKDAYYLALRQTQRTIRTDTPNWQPWLTLFLKSLSKAGYIEKHGAGRGTWYGLA